VLSSSQRERRVSRLNRTGNNTTGWARRLTALLVTACLVMAMALPVYAEVDLLPDAPDEVELLEDEQGTVSGEDTVPPEQNAATPVPDAATPEPEQSAEPEQPAPTETPEPTAEPTPTPEPAATATATPVPTVTPTVTPTATPEPTEQPQKMYAAKSVDNVQAASEGGVPDTYTLYFAVPTKWKDYTKVKIYAVDGKDSNTYHKYFLDMLEVGETKDQRKIYSVVLDHQKHYQYGGLNGLEFRGYNGDAIADENPAYKVVIAQVDNNNNPPWMTFNSGDHYIGGNYYDGNKNKGDGWNRDDWTTYTVGHKLFAGEKMAFENKTSKTLTNVKAWFYELDEETGKLNPIGGPISLNSDGLDSGIASGSTATFDIPNDYCSFVRFTAGDGNTEISEYYNFYNEEVKGENQKRFQYSEGQCYCYMYNGNDDATWGRPGATRIYYDATFSKLPTTGRDDTGGDYSIPKANSKETIYFRIKGDGVESESGTLVKDGTNKNLYYIDIPQGYSSIIFSGEKIDGDEETKRHGLSTEWLPIPTDDKNCFYADTNDDAVYKDTTRGGYWAPKGTKRDAETWKDTGTKVVDIASAPFTEEANTKYVTSTLYDYYTDYELNGKNRDNYGGWTGVSHRNWVTFREFDQALSDYYQEVKAEYPIYTGHFQPADGTEFSQIAETLKLFGYDNFIRFRAINNSQYNEDQNSGNKHYDYAYQGLVEGTTSTGDATGEPLLKDTKTVEPHFNKDFLSGENSKNAKLGEVYENVKFPFTKVQNLFGNETDVDYWCFDSKDTTLYLKQDSGQNPDSKYFLQSTKNRESSKNVNASSGFDNVTNTYGYFPFNEKATSGAASTYNYGFGTKLQMDFTLTDDGMLETDNGSGTKVKTSIKFFFSGDDDVWVFIDGKLALDVGGAHGKVSGLLEFGKANEKNNSVTAYVSKVKKGGTSKEDQDKKFVKHVKYNNEDIDFYAQGTTLNDLAKGQKHTLTMYYVERGMWESNMAVAFNFPDNNELQVQKIVDTTDVNDWFKSCFDTPDLFAFNIKNQATHYQNPKQDATIDSDVNLIKLNNSDYASCKPATENSKGNIFKLTTAPTGEEALHWYGQYQDTNPPSECRSERYGILTLRDAIDISQKRYLTFDIYAKSESGQGVLSLGNLYLELLDKNGKQKGCLDKTCLNGTTYGTVTLANDKWITVKLDLYKLNAEDDFDPKQVTTIRVGDNYPRHIYFRNFVFSAQAKATTKTGFTTKQEDIPVYGSIDAKGLKNAAGAQFTTTKNNDTQVVDKNGQFMLQNGETVTFSDQFRRGSYISLKETLSPNLYDTTWTVFENDEAVQSYGSGETVNNGGTQDLNGQAATESQPGPDDGRTEVYNPAPDIANNGYTANQKPENANTIVFRSYKDPDENTSSLTKLKVQFVNKVKTGKLVIKKAAASDEVNLIKGKYTFNVTFTNVGDESLEQKPIKKQVTINMKTEDHCEISGIPIGTRFRIEEVKPSDGSHLQGVSVIGGGADTQVVGNTYVQGSISETDVTATFTNTMHELINIDFTKTWVNANGDPLEDGLPKEIYVQLQRRKTKNDPWQPVGYPDANTEYVTVRPIRNGWNCAFPNLDKFDVNDSTKTNYEYRIVEGTVDDNDSFTEVKPNETIPIKGNTYGVTAEAKAEISEGNSTKVTNATVNGGTITGDSGTIVLTNTLQNPKFVLNIIKKDAEKGENNKEVFLKDVEFKLEKLKAETTTTEGEPQWVVDTTYKFDNENTGSITATTKGDGKITDVFKNLEPGTYRLTETKAHPGYNLLAQPIVIKFTQGGECYIDGEKITDTKTFVKSGNTYTMNLTVLNRKTPELPHTGADAPSLWLLIGMPLAVAGLLIFTFRYNRKGGRRH
jgi:LPXTG-motif cell wall-anchored protein